MDHISSTSPQGTLVAHQNGIPENGEPSLPTSTGNQQYSENMKVNGTSRVSPAEQTGVDNSVPSQLSTPSSRSLSPSRYKLAYSSNYSDILDPVIQNNYQLFMVERLILLGARTFVKTFKEDENDLSLTDDRKKNTKIWQIPVYTIDAERS